MGSSNVETETLRVDYQEQGGAELVASLEAVKARVADLDTQYGRGYLTADQYKRSKKELAAESRALAKQLKEADDAARRTGGGVAGLGQTVQSTGRIVQDFSAAGLNGIINNLEQLGQGFAKQMGKSAAFGAALGGGMQLAGVALQLAMPHIKGFLELLSPEQVDPFKSSIEVLGDRVDKLKEKMKSVGQNPIVVAVQKVQLEAAEADLKRLTKALEAYEEARTSKTKAERESESLVKEATAGAGAEGALKRYFGARQEAADPALVAKREEIAAERAKLDKWRRFMADPSVGDNQKRDRSGEGDMREVTLRRLEMEAAARVASIYGKGGSAEQEAGKSFAQQDGERVADQQGRLAGNLEKAGRGDLAAKVRENSPERVQRRGEQKEGLARFADRQKAAQARADEAQKESDIEFEALNDKAVEGGKALTKQRKERQEAQKKTDKKADEAKKKREAAEKKARDEIDRDAGRAAGQFGDEIDPFVQEYLLRQKAGRDSLAALPPHLRKSAEADLKRRGQMPLGEEEARDRASAEVSRRLGAAGATDAEGRPLGATQKGVAARKIVEAAGENAAERLARLQAEGNGQLQATQRALGDLQGIVAGLSAQVGVANRNNQELARRNRQLGNTAQRRGRQ